MSRTVLKVCGGWWWLRPILVFSLSLDQAEQKSCQTEHFSLEIYILFYCFEVKSDPLNIDCAPRLRNENYSQDPTIL